MCPPRRCHGFFLRKAESVFTFRLELRQRPQEHRPEKEFELDLHYPAPFFFIRRVDSTERDTLCDRTQQALL